MWDREKDQYTTGIPDGPLDEDQEEMAPISGHIPELLPEDEQTHTYLKGRYPKWERDSAQKEIDEEVPLEDRGFHGVSPFCALDYFDPSKQFVTDIMHIVGNNLERFVKTIVGHKDQKYTEARAACDKRHGHLNDINRNHPEWVVPPTIVERMDGDVRILPMAAAYGALMPLSLQGIDISCDHFVCFL